MQVNKFHMVPKIYTKLCKYIWKSIAYHVNVNDLHLPHHLDAIYMAIGIYMHNTKFTLTRT
jgi:hypothetical protein